MLLDNKPYTFDRVVRCLITIVIAGALLWLMAYLSDVLIPFAAALLLAYLMNPLVELIQKKISNRVAAVLLSLTAVLILCALACWVVVPMVAEEVSHMGGTLSALVEDARLKQAAAERLPAKLWESIEAFARQEDVKAFFEGERLGPMIRALMQKVLPGVWGIMTGTATVIMELVGLAVIGLYLVFLLLDYRKLSHDWKELIPHAYREPLLAFLKEFESAMSQYFRGQALVALICGILFAIGFSIIGLPLAILLGLFNGLLNMIPYMQILGFFPALLLGSVRALETGQSFWVISGLILAVFAVVQIIQDAVLVPRIMGKALGLSPVVILLSLSIWGKLMGLFGLIIALPMTFLILVYYRRLLATAKAVEGKG